MCGRLISGNSKTPQVCITFQFGTNDRRPIYGVVVGDANDSKHGENSKKTQQNEIIFYSRNHLDRFVNIGKTID